MSYNSLSAQNADIEFSNRITAAVEKEAHNNPAFGDTDYGTAVIRGQVGAQLLFWPVCIATEAAYEAALLNHVLNPGKDESVVTDAAILSAIQASWPPDPWPPESTPPA